VQEWVPKIAARKGEPPRALARIAGLERAIQSARFGSRRGLRPGAAPAVAGVARPSRGRQKRVRP
jgi:hypothetical protein